MATSDEVKAARETAACGMKVRDDLIAQLKEHHTKTLQGFLTKEQLEIIFGEAQVNPDDACWPLGEDEVVKAVQRFLKERDELADEIECRKSHTDTEIAELKAEVKKLKEERDTSLTILQEANSEVLADVKGGLTKAKLKAQIRSQDETIKYGRERLTGMISRLVDATELLNTLGYTFDEDEETWEEKEKCVGVLSSAKACDYNLPKKKEETIEDIKEQHQETLDEIREYLGRFGGDEVEVFDKIVKGEEEDEVEEKVEESRVQNSYDSDDEEGVGAWRIYCGEDAWRCNLPSEEEFFDTEAEAKARIDEINKESGSAIKLSYDTIDYEWYSSSWVKGEEEEEELTEEQKKNKEFLEKLFEEDKK